MKKAYLFLGLFLILQSCIPIRIAPTIKNFKITQGKKFKRDLPKRHMFIFQDHKQANAFYNYVNTKFELQDIDVYDNVPFTIQENQYFFSFYEADIPNKTINLIPIAIDVMLDKADIDPAMEQMYKSRKGNWYIAIEVYSDTENDCLQPTSKSKQAVSDYLQKLKDEYVTTYNYNEVLFQK